MAELTLMFASRVQHVDEIIAPALAAGQIVLCDRFTDSSEAYQGGGRKLGSKTVLELNRFLCGDLRPDLTILMDSDVAASVDRLPSRSISHPHSSWPTTQPAPNTAKTAPTVPGACPRSAT